ncbi:OLC1v1030103C1 [Oldenlandia corymbosa var. corymbosa]|uniref:RBR-type E3 ubiquitin transferase n=1 Tax=Oldenlandia corymbosa var. corymbosa TaxID=529605 RepID=A0AAV1CIA1_OLDCO|nr:OLC1v1030103C1 [Oldenlandia corymbosa var. corymbosa]
MSDVVEENILFDHDSDGGDDDDVDDLDLGYNGLTNIEAENPPGQWDDTVEFRVLGGREIQTRVEAHISKISSLISVSKEAALVLLCKYRWDVGRILDEWFSDENKIRQACGLVKFTEDDSSRAGGNRKGEFFCGICLETYHHDAVNSFAVRTACGHLYCENCWRTYVSTAINGGAGSLYLRCPQPNCGASVSDMITSSASDEDRAKYENYILSSYVGSFKYIKRCPAPEGCEFAVECLFRGFGNYNPCYLNVTCKCSYQFCWNCLEEAHSPVDCETVAKWRLESVSESHNVEWILANTKSCPKCKRRIEKYGGCDEICCAEPCGFFFCWMCLSPMSEHDNVVCGLYKEGKKGEFNEEEEIRQKAKNSLEKFLHYYDRWVINQNSRMKALADMKQLRINSEKFRNIHHLPVCRVQFIMDACAQVAECRRVLKWLYAFGYFLQVEEKIGPAKKAFFDYVCAEAESTFERLRASVEEELPKHIRERAHPAKLMSFGTKVANLTRINRTYFQNLGKGVATCASKENQP